jgi:hypothetical protein
MRQILSIVVVVCAAACISSAAEKSANTVNGNYIEARTADVYTGPCFANGEAEEIGREAVFGWKVVQGRWDGVDLSGMAVVGAIRTPHTLGMWSEPVNPAKAVLIIDSRANDAQRAALTAFAKYMGGDLLKEIVQVDYAPIELTVKDGNIHTGTAKLTAGSLAAIQTRGLMGADAICGNEEVWYPPLTELEHSMPAFAEENSFQGKGLDETWNNRFKRSGFVGTFRVTEESGTGASR